MDLHQLVLEKTKGFKGVYRFTKAKLERPEHFALNDQITALRNKLTKAYELVEQAKAGKDWGLYFGLVKQFENEYGDEAQELQHLIRHLNRICKTEVVIVENLVPTVGRTMIANNLTDATPTDVMLINKAELGSGVTAPANGDTALQTPVYRNDVASLTNSSNIAYITAFFNATETTGTYREAGLYSNGSGTLGNGVLVSRVAINVTKSSSETFTIDWQLTIN